MMERVLVLKKENLRFLTAALFVPLLANSLLKFASTGNFYFALQAIYELVAIVLSVRQRPAQTLDFSYSAFAFVSLHLALPMLLNFEGSEELRLVPLFLVVLGLAIAVLSLIDLNSSFGIMPACRSVRTSGLYKFLRHPAYAGYVISAAGITLAFPSVQNIFILIAYVLATIARIQLEERVLTSSSEDYRAYKSRVLFRLIPGVY